MVDSTSRHLRRRLSSSPLPTCGPYPIPEVGSDAQAGAVTQAVYESLGEAFSQQDLTTFQNAFGLPVQGVSTFIGDGVHSNGVCSTESNCGEANLDVQYLMAVAPNTPTTYWYSSEGTSYDDWITSVAQAESIPDVISISYGAIESELGSSTLNAFNTEALKLGAQGVTIVVSSGDDGVANFMRPSRRGACGYNPSFPASSPYVLAVGATQGAEKAAPRSSVTQTGASITSGGGFSAVFDQPSYQSAAVSSCLAQVSGTAREPERLRDHRPCVPRCGDGGSQLRNRGWGASYCRGWDLMRSAGGRGHDLLGERRRRRRAKGRLASSTRSSMQTARAAGLVLQRHHLGQQHGDLVDVGRVFGGVLRGERVGPDDGPWIGRL